MTNKERWNGWVLVSAGAHRYLGKTSHWGGDTNPIVLQPCVQVVEQFPIVPGPDNKTLSVTPMISLVTIGLFGTDNVWMLVNFDTLVRLDDFSEEQLQPYTEAYDNMLKRLRPAIQAEGSGITAPTVEDIIRLGRGGGTGGNRN
jgi:hypothetical protein